MVFSTFGAEGRWFDSTSNHHVETLGKSFTRNCLYNVMWRPVAAFRQKFDSCNSLLSSVHTLLVNILRCVRLYIKRKYIISMASLWLLLIGFGYSGSVLVCRSLAIGALYDLGHRHSRRYNYLRLPYLTSS